MKFMGEIWDNPKAKRQKRAADVLRGKYGKGSSPRNNNSEAFRLGWQLTNLDKNSKEYQDTLKAWRKAVQEGR